jgi:hypothetical protein
VAFNLLALSARSFESIEKSRTVRLCEAIDLHRNEVRPIAMERLTPNILILMFMHTCIAQ